MNDIRRRWARLAAPLLAAAIGLAATGDALAQETWRIQSLWRGVEMACEDGSSERCAPIHVSRIAPSPSERDGVALALPAPCEVPITGFAIAQDGSWYYGACEATTRPTHVVYAIQFEPRYAHAERLHAGCTPRGLSPFGEGVAVVATCEGQIQGTRLEAGGRALSHFEAPPHIGCDGDDPVIQIGSVTAPLTAARGDLEALLPTMFAPPGTKAVWSGDNVLVAQAVESDVTIRRYACQRGVFRRNDHE